MRKNLFLNRSEAGVRLAQAIKRINLDGEGIILALPRGGVVIGYEAAKYLNLPLDIIVTRKIGAPLNKEYAIAAISANRLILNQNEQIADDYLKEQIKNERLEIKRRMKQYRGNRSYPKLKGKFVILIDDGLATGMTMIAAIEEVKLLVPRQIIVAIPVAPPDTIINLKKMVDKIVVLAIEPLFFAVAQFYQDFQPVDDPEVIKLLAQSWQKRN